MENIIYPIVTTSGDLAITTETEQIAISRGRLFLDIKTGERLFYPDYGVDNYLFMPDLVTSDFETSVIESGLNQWATHTGDTYTYQVINKTLTYFDFSITVII